MGVKFSERCIKCIYWRWKISFHFICTDQMKVPSQLTIAHPISLCSWSFFKFRVVFCFKHKRLPLFEWNERMKIIGRTILICFSNQLIVWMCFEWIVAILTAKWKNHCKSLLLVMHTSCSSYVYIRLVKLRG